MNLLNDEHRIAGLNNADKFLDCSLSKNAFHWRADFLPDVGLIEVRIHQPGEAAPFDVKHFSKDLAVFRIAT